jgi:RecB family exonuclease
MPALPHILNDIARARRRDPLAPITVIVPSHVAGIQLRRRLAEIDPFAGVRFETLPRLAELLGAASLARSNRAPLARPIGDYLAAQVTREARADLADVRDLPGFARVLRQTFQRLRRGGFRRAEEVPIALGSGLLGEVVRLFGLFRAASSNFYDDEDLLDAAAATVDERRGTLVEELGDIYVLPPGALTAGAERLLTALRRAIGAAHYKAVDETTSSPEARFVLAPDPASEAREVAREVLRALQEGCGLHEIAVFHGADPSYRALLVAAFESAGLPIAAMPGTPLSETPAGRGVLALAELPVHDYSRTLTIDCLSLAPLRPFLPATDGSVAAQPATWRRLAREAGITQGAARWRSGLSSLITDLEADVANRHEDEERRERYQAELSRARELQSLIAALTARLEPLRHPQPAASFIEAFKAVVDAYLDPAATAISDVLLQIEQLGTIDAVDGSFSLDSFAAALRANLEAAYHREASLGEGVLVADYRIAAGLSFRRAILCGAYEGVFPAGPPAETLVADSHWAALRGRGHAMLEDAELRSQRAQEQALRAANVATERLVWTAPLQASGAGREHYPSQLMLRAARERSAELHSASELRRSAPAAWLRRPASPLAALLTGPVLDKTELRIRSSLVARRDGRRFADDHAIARALTLLRARRSDRFGEYDGNLTALAGEALIPRGTVSPTTLEYYASCGMRYFLGAVLRLRPPEEPEERDTIDPAEKGSIVHAALQEFFVAQHAVGRPAQFEPWTEVDRDLLLSILERRLDEARVRGRTGLDVFAEHERRRLRADLSAFLEQDTAFRQETGAVPQSFEIDIPETEESGLRLRGIVDRVDWSPDGRHAWVIDYKTGSARSYEGMKDDDPLAGGTKLQLPVYLAAVPDAEKATPLYWFISSAAEFERREFPTTSENLRRYRETLGAILDGLKRGAFPANPGEEDTRWGGWTNCKYCDFDRLCSRRRDDELVEKRNDAALHPWSRVGQVARGETP